MRRLSPLDHLIGGLDDGLRIGAGMSAAPVRPSPADGVSDGELAPAERRLAARLVRVDHAGEVAAQALYQGQAVVARGEQQAEYLRAAAAEEADHLAWCAERLTELGERPSRLGPVWYAGSFAIGALAGVAGDRVSLGFVVETERQVERHLDDHLERLPAGDRRSRAILGQMKADEIRHGRDAAENGGRPLPGPIRGLMRAVSKVMTTGAFWV